MRKVHISKFSDQLRDRAIVDFKKRCACISRCSPFARYHDEYRETCKNEAAREKNDRAKERSFSSQPFAVRHR